MSDTLQEFAAKLTNDTVDLPPEASAVISEHFWELLAGLEQLGRDKQGIGHSEWWKD